MKHTPGPVEASENCGPYPICAVEADYETWYVNAVGAVREEAGDDARFIAWCYNNALMLAAAPAMYEALEAFDAAERIADKYGIAAEQTTEALIAAHDMATAALAAAQGES